MHIITRITVAGLAALLVAATPAFAADLLLSLAKNGDRLDAFDVETHEKVFSVAVGAGPHEITVDPGGRFAWVANFGHRAPENTVSVVDLRQQKVVETVDLGPLTRPHGIVWHDGHVWFTAEGAKAVGRLNAETHDLDWACGTGRGQTHMLVISPESGEIFTTDMSGGTVTVIEPSAGMEASVEHLEMPGRPEGIALSPDAKLLAVGDNDGGAISLIDAESKEAIGQMNGGQTPIRLAFGPDGKTLYATDMPAGRFRKFDVDRREQTGEVEVGESPVGFVLDEEGKRAYVSCSGDDFIRIVDLETMEVTGEIEAGPIPDGIALTTVAEGVAEEDGAGREPEGEGARLGVVMTVDGEQVVLVEVVEGSPADEAGLRQGDRILRIAGEPVDEDPLRVVKAWQEADSGEELTIRVLRGDEERDVMVRVP